MRAHKPPATISSQLTSRFHCNDLVPIISQVSIQRSCPRGLAAWFAAIGGCQVSLQPYRHPYAGEGPNSHFWNSNFPKRLSGPSGGLGVTTTISSQTTCRSQPGRRHSEVFNKIKHFKWSRPWALMGYSVGSHGLLCLEFRSSQTASRSQRAPRSRSEFVVFRTRVQSAAG